ncbi:MAG: hypothetical protein ACFFC7_20120 [Candidatus Hermodarchaeota archaeon]
MNQKSISRLELFLRCWSDDKIERMTALWLIEEGYAEITREFFDI